MADEFDTVEAAPAVADSPTAEPDYSQGVGVDDITRYLDSHGSTEEDSADTEPDADATLALETGEDDSSTTDTDDGEDASLGGTETPDDRSPMIPRPRFDQVLERAKTAETQLGELEKVKAFQPVIERFEQLGFSPEQIVDAFDQWATSQAQGNAPPPAETQPLKQAEDATEPFDLWCQEQGLDPYELAPGEYAALQVGYRAEQRAEAAVKQLASWEQERQAERQQRLAEQQALETARQEALKEQQIAQWSTDLEGVKTQFPVFKDPEAQQDLILRWEADPEQRPMAFHAENLLNRWQTTFRNQLSRQAVEQSAAARQRPVVAGGNAPSPAKAEDYSALSPLEMQRRVEARLNEAQRAGQ